MEGKTYTAKMGIGSYVLILLVIAGVSALALFLFLPKTNYQSAFNNVYNIQDSYYQKNINNKNVDEYLNIILDIDNISTYHSTQINLYSKILSILNLSNIYCMNALMVIDPQAEYNDLVFKQKTSLDEFLKTKSELSTHLTFNMRELFNNPTLNQTTVSEYVAPFINKFKKLVEEYASFYYKTARLINDGTLRGIENNELTITANREINLAISRILNVSDIYNCFNYVNSLQSHATIMYDEDFYLEYYNGGYSVNDVINILGDICP
ncbi:MAG: hypothetical protein PHX09_00880 [Clostridia bacterium]|nr:hypothetical protein [Clostridia bacterium]MDD4685832.1 hypothetical protein [Clostridia bacterium]